MDTHLITNAEVAKEQFIQAHQKYRELRGIHLTFSGIVLLGTVMAIIAIPFGQFNQAIIFILIVGYSSFAAHLLSLFRVKKDLLQLKVWLEGNDIRIGKKKDDALARLCFVDAKEPKEDYELTSPSITIMSMGMDFKEYNRLFEIQ